MSDLDITEHRIPQDGRFKLRLSKKQSVDFRVSVCPTLFGEKIVLRILNPAQNISRYRKIRNGPRTRKTFFSCATTFTKE